MKVRMRTAYAGPHGNHPIGSLPDFPKAEARALIAGGYAEDVEEEAKRQARVEKAAKKSAGKKDKETTSTDGGPETTIDNAKT